MNKRLTALLAGLALASGVGAANAADVPDILGSVDSKSYQAMSAPEMGAVQGELAVANAIAGANAFGWIFASTGTATTTSTFSVPFFNVSASGSASSSASGF